MDTHASGVSVALKARSRDTGQPLAIVNERYYVASGLASDNINPWWSFDFQFSPGPNGTLADNFQLYLTIDFDPALNQSNIISFGGTIPYPPTVQSVKLNPGPGQWSDDSIDFVVSESWHLGFAFWQQIWGTAYDPNALGEYTLTLTAKNASAVTLAESSIVVVVPEPASLSLLALGGLGLLRRRRN